MPEDKIKVLLIDDDEKFCRLIKDYFHLQGNYRVLVASSGSIGTYLSRLSWHRPKVILLDIMMPGIDGFEVLRRIRNTKATMYTPVIMVTAVSELSAKIKAEGLYCDDYVVKPVNLKELKEKIESLLAKKGI
jgi:DNA-binding response OmpR family regulator